MTDTYQAVYEAVRSKLSSGNIGDAVQSAMRDANISFYADQASEAIKQVAFEYLRPSVLFRPALSADGNQWCALYGENLQEGVAGFGDTPAAAMYAFDDAWLNEKLPSKQQKDN